jgi:hypothetical protein
VVFGHRLSEQDRHLVDALNEHPQRTVAVSLRDAGWRENRRKKHRMASLLDTEEIHFFESKIHPLGSEKLRMKEMARREVSA